MIFGTKETIHAYKGLNERIDRAIDYILHFDSSTEPGRYEIDGDNLYANVFCGETASMEMITFEAHRQYLDLQYLVEGSEIMIYAPLETCTSISDYDKEEDFCFYRGSGTKFKVQPGNFYLLHPFDAHAPGYGSEMTTYKKVVVKIKI